jgi:hypothetical protein
MTPFTANVTKLTALELKRKAYFFAVQSAPKSLLAPLQHLALIPAVEQSLTKCP